MVHWWLLPAPGPQLIELGPKLPHFLLESGYTVHQRGVTLACRSRIFRGNTLRGSSRRRLAAEEMHVARLAPSRLTGQSRDERAGFALEQSLQGGLDLGDVGEGCHPAGA